MEKSLFHKTSPKASAPTPYELIEPEVVHLKKGYSVRHGPKGAAKTAPWLVILAFVGLAWLYLMDPFLHAWYKGEAVKTYLYLHNYGTGTMARSLVASQIFAPDEIDVLNRRLGSFQDYYPSLDAANHQAEKIIAYMNSLHRLHAGDYQQLDPVGRMRYALFIYPGIVVPTEWSFLEPTLQD